MQAINRSGRCRCGAVRFTTRGEPQWVAHCHCESCRRATSAAFATYAGFATDAVHWSGTPPRQYCSSPGVHRGFCATCGSPMSFTSERWPGETHLFVASFDAPGQLTPQSHVYVEEQLPWVRLDDGLPRQPKTTG